MESSTDRSIEARLGDALSKTDSTIAVAESCTGGLVGSLLTDIPGASEYFDRSVVTYSYGAKRDLLAIDREILDEHGAVSAPVAGAMARGIRDTADTTWGVSTTGVAGPSGGSETTPVGTVYIGVAFAAPWGSGDSTTTIARFEFDGDRREIKALIARQALSSTLEAIETRERDDRDDDRTKDNGDGNGNHDGNRNGNHNGNDDPDDVR